MSIIINVKVHVRFAIIVNVAFKAKIVAIVIAIYAHRIALCTLKHGHDHVALNGPVSLTGRTIKLVNTALPNPAVKGFIRKHPTMENICSHKVAIPMAVIAPVAICLFKGKQVTPLLQLISFRVRGYAFQYVDGNVIGLVLHYIMNRHEVVPDLVSPGPVYKIE